ncbi:tyrosine-type recombinase/integrase [Pseudidiomarina sp. 1APP75-32.1]|uniref:Tyrosine-type recombinase/integrase n=1 Tax=Pseudidiomarina terrestris TaxID=2820060 RepID=A0AAW7R1D8_9GAMM|nr:MULTISPECIES: site-specific integrase [unclassified Pseudidiomarina]MDN7125511.1 tyrosine-type recombinase/integrase [Pseudidiomarina sp. 1APP75-32.1]MDN7130269.1 tyrosine-type recombinase/integrase [Pseudidiomarina sp. 1APR75-15]
MNSQKIRTPRALDALKPATDGKRFRVVVDAKGIAKGTLLCVVTPTGKKTFYTRALFRNQRIDIRLGSYPALSLKDAVAQHNKCMLQIDEGHDPRRIRAAAKIKNQSILNMDELFEKWHQHASQTKGCKQSTIDTHRWRWYSYLSPSLGKLSINAITRADLLSTLDKCASRSKEQTRKAFTTLNLPLDYALARMLITENPCRTIKPKDVQATKGKPRNRNLSITEIKALWQELDQRAQRHTPQMITILKLALLTGARRSEITQMKWSQLTQTENYWIWNIPETKNGMPHRIYLFGQSIQLLQNLTPITGNSDWVFESNKCENKSIRSDSVTYMIARMRDDFDIQHFTLHDLRRTAATQWVEQLSADSTLVELMLNHLPQNQLVRTYQVVAREKEQQETWQQWDRLIADVVNE